MFEFFVQKYSMLGAIHKPCGQIFGHFNPPPPLWTILLNKAYVVIWTLGKLPLPPAMSTWFLNDPPFFEVCKIKNASVIGNI